MVSRREFLKGAGVSMALLATAPATLLAQTTSSGAAHGVFDDGIFDAWWRNGNMGIAIDSTASRNGRKPTIVQFYGSWRNNYGQPTFPKKHLDAIVSKGCQPLFTWQAENGHGDSTNFSPAKIAAGGQDTTIREFARAAVAWGKPLWVRIFHEADLRGHGQYPWQSGSAYDVIRAYRRTVDIFRREGATNVSWVWNPSANQSYNALKSVFPGDSYVDYTGGDLYGNPEWNGGWKSFTQVFWNPYQHLKSLSGKPMIIGEYGQIEGNAGWKGEWIRKAMAEEIQPYFPLVKAMVYFDSWDWKLNSSSAALNGYKAGIASSYMNSRI